MKKNFNVLLTHPATGEPLAKSLTDPTPCLASHAIADALLGYRDQNINAEVARERFNLAKLLLSSDGEVDVSSEQLGDIKKILPKSYSPLIAGQIVELIEQ